MNEKNTQNVIPNVSSKKKEERNVPDLRFKFNSEWGKENIGNLIERTGKKAKKDELKYTPYSITNTDGFVIQSDNWEGGSYVQASKEGYKLIYNNEIAYNPARINVGSIGYFDKNVGIISSLYVCFKTKNKLHSKYLYHFMKSNIFRKIVMKRQEGGVRDYFFYENLCGVKISYPIIEEQEKIVSFLELINERIYTQKKIISKYESLIFLIYNELLSNKTNEKLGNICEIKKGTQLNTDSFDSTGEYPVINGGINISGYTTSYNCKNMITISEGGNSCGFVNYLKNEFWSGGHNYTLKKKTEFNYEYLYHYLKFKEKSIMSLRVGSGLPNIQKPVLQNFPVYLPDIRIQNKYACILDAILEKIKIEKGILTLYIKEKEYLLNKLFI